MSSKKPKGLIIKPSHGDPASWEEQLVVRQYNGPIPPAPIRTGSPYRHKFMHVPDPADSSCLTSKKANSWYFFAGSRRIVLSLLVTVSQLQHLSVFYFLPQLL
jgi:hypothetical protein